jgi:hypothetical protein
VSLLVCGRALALARVGVVVVRGFVAVVEGNGLAPARRPACRRELVAG